MADIGRFRMETLCVRGKLISCVTFCEQELHAPPWVLDTVRNGYVLLFYSLPTPYSWPYTTVHGLLRGNLFTMQCVNC